MEKQLFAFPEICSGCRSCEMWCSFVHKKGFGPSRGLIRVAKDPQGEFDMPMINCNGKCPHPLNEEGDPLCVEMCPTGAIVYTDLDDAFEKRSDLHMKRQVQPLFRLMAPWKWPYPWREWAEGGQ